MKYAGDGGVLAHYAVGPGVPSLYRRKGGKREEEERMNSIQVLQRLPALRS